MKILLLGATGFSGSVVLQELLKADHIVTATTRNKEAISESRPNLHVIEGDVKDESFVWQALTGQDAVINCLGIGGKGDGKPNHFVSDATHVLVSQMKKSPVRRLICMSNVGAGDSMKFLPWIFTKLILPYFMKWLKVIIEDKNRMESLVMESDLLWTIARFPNIVDKPAKHRIVASMDGKGLKMAITNHDAAHFLLEQLHSDAFLQKAPCVSN